jgi:hypothetical protein
MSNRVLNANRSKFSASSQRNRPRYRGFGENLYDFNIHKFISSDFKLLFIQIACIFKCPKLAASKVN